MITLVIIYAIGVIVSGAITGYVGFSLARSAVVSFGWPVVLLALAVG